MRKASLAINLNVPNYLTLLRVLLTAAAAGLLVMDWAGYRLVAGVVLLAAWSTDWFDGFFARRLGQTTDGGAVFDLITDRILLDTISVVSVILGLWSRTSGLVPFTPFPYLGVAWAVDFTLLIGIMVFIYKRQTRQDDYPLPTPTLLAKLVLPFQVVTLILAVTGIGPDIVLAAVMYVTLAITLAGTVSYLKKGSFVFVR